MKKKLLTITFVLFSILIFSQSIPNGGFESWTINNFENPASFINTSNYQFVNGSSQTGVNVTKTTDAYHGTYAIKLLTTGTGTNVNFAYFSNGDPGKTPAQGGTPYSQKPTGIRFYYKSNIIAPDSALFIAVFKKAGVAIGTYLYKIGSTQTACTLFNKTFTPALTVNPDTVVIAAASSNAFANFALAGNSLQIDSVSFTGVTSQPANFNGDFEVWQPKQDDKLNGWLLRGDFKRTTDFFSGSYAIELQTTIQSFGGSGISAGEAYTGVYTPTTVSAIGLIGGAPYTVPASLQDTLVFHYKYIPADPTDNGEVYLYFKKNGVQTTQAQFTLAISPGYTQKLALINFTSTTVADSVNISFRSSKYPYLASYAGSDLKIDNMYLTSQKIPITKFNSPTAGCLGQPIQLTDNSGNMANNWAWIMPGGTPGSSTAQNPTVTYNTLGIKTISMIANNQFGSGILLSKTITINALPVIAATSTITACGGSNVVLTASGASTYTWSGGQTTPTIAVNATVTTNYTVTGTSSGCSNSGIASVIVPSGITPQICMVTTDSLGNNNEIYWDKTLYSRVDSFIVYRETPTITNTLTGSYSRIGAVSKNALSMFTDTTRSVGSFINGNPNFTSYKYKLQIRDSCGVYSALSPYHQTMFLQDQQNGNFNWNPYTIEGQVAPVSNYVLTRRNLTTGITSTVAGTSSNLLSDPYYNVFYSTNVKWFVDAQGFNCNPTLKLSGIAALKTRTKSNQSNEKAFPTIGVKENNLYNANINAYPNPTKGILNVEFVTLSGVDANYQCSITNILGQELQTINILNQKTTLNIEDLKSGIYYLNVKKNYQIVSVKKIIVE
jgi:hypothetical protein